MQSLQAMSKVPSQSSSLPPLQNLPSWSRNSLGRRKPPRPIIRDRLQPIKSIREEMDESAEDDKLNEKSSYLGRIVSAPSRGHGLDETHRVDNVEKRMDYLRTQHAETLSNLHNEIERLKAENKELNFKLVMARTGVNLGKDDPSLSSEESHALQSAGSDEAVQGDLLGIQNMAGHKNEEKPSLQQPVKETSSRNTAQQASSSSAKRNKRHGSGNKGAEVKSTPTPPVSAKSSNSKPKSSGKSKTKSRHSQEKHSNLSPPYAFALNATPPSGAKQGIPQGQSLLVVTIKDKTVKVHMPTDSAPRSPTLVECKAIIEHQQETNKRQEQELSKLKSDLNDALYSDKWTPDAYLLAKSYVTEEMLPNTRHNTPATRSLPRLHSREQTHSGRMAAGRLHYVHDSVSLPALRPNGAPTVADRKRRQQAVVRGRGKKDFYS